MYLKVFNFVTSNIYKINTFCIWVLLINHKFQFHHKSYWSCYIFTDLVYLVRKVMHEIVQFLSLSTQFLHLWISDVQNMTHNDEMGTFWNLYLWLFILSIWELGAREIGTFWNLYLGFLFWVSESSEQAHANLVFHHPHVLRLLFQIQLLIFLSQFEKIALLLIFSSLGHQQLEHHLWSLGFEDNARHPKYEPGLRQFNLLTHDYDQLTKKRVQKCDGRADLHSCNALWAKQWK